MRFGVGRRMLTSESATGRPAGGDNLRPCTALVLIITAFLIGCGPPQPSPRTAPVASTAAIAAPAPSSVPASRSDLVIVDPVTAATTPDTLGALCRDNLRLAERIASRVAALDPTAGAALGFDPTLGQLDDALTAVRNASDYASLLGVVHPDRSMRQAARACESSADEVTTRIWLDGQLGGVLRAYADAALEGGRLGEERARFAHHVLRELRRHGSMLAPAEQERLRALNASLTEVGQGFIAGINAAEGFVHVAAGALAGFPPAFVVAHPPDGAGRITITTGAADYFDFVTFSPDRRAARALYRKQVNGGGDQNLARLDRMLALRHEKATLLGYRSWADFATEPAMAGTGERASAFLDRVGAAVETAAAAELRGYEALWLELGHGAVGPPGPPDLYYLDEHTRRLRFGVDARQIASYFEVEAVMRGVFGLASRLFDLDFEPVVGAPTWAPSVSVVDVSSGGEPVGRLYLDLVPRPDKYRQAAMFPIRTGKRLSDGRVQLPIAALVCDLPPAGQPMSHRQVVTLLHEIGHLLHHLLSRTETASLGGTSTARDFTETPSQLFEEWAWSAEVLRTLTRSPTDGAPMPAELATRLVQARRVGLALGTQRQVFFARLDLRYHTQPPPFDTTAVLTEVHRQSWLLAHVAGTHLQSSFAHLVGYDAAYYGYQWALAHAKDALGPFVRVGMMNPAVPRRWRDTVLVHGGARDPQQLLTAFLGRPPGVDAYLAYLTAPP